MYKVTNQAFDLFFTQKLRNLRILNLDEARLLLDSSIVLVAENCPNLRHLSLQWCPLIESTSISAIMLKCKHLKTFDLSGSKKITDAAFTKAIEVDEKNRLNKDLAIRPLTALDSL